MTTPVRFGRFQPNRRTAAAWAALNPVLLMGEPGLETDTKRSKTGDGTTHWNDLPYDDEAIVEEAVSQAAASAVSKLPAGYYTPVGKPDGALSEFDTGETAYTFGGSVGGVVNDEIIHTPTGAPSATYYEIDAGALVTRVTCEVKWTPGALGGLCIALPIEPWGPPGGHPSGSGAALEVAGVHLVLYGNGIWHCSRWNVGTETKYAESTTHGRFADVRDGEFRTVDVWIDHSASSATVQFPDGSFRTFSHPAIAADTSSWVIWEQYNFTGAGEVACVLRDLSFDTQTRRRDSFAATKVDIAEAVTALRDVLGLEYVPTAAGTKTMDALSPQIQVFTGTQNHTLVLPSAGIPQGYPVIVNNSSTGVITINSSAGNFVTALSSGGTAQLWSFNATPTTAGHWLALALVTVSGTQTLTGKTLSAAKIANNGFLADNNGNEQIVFGTTASAVNEIKVTNAAAGSAPSVVANGADPNIDFIVGGKGTGIAKTPAGNPYGVKVAVPATASSTGVVGQWAADTTFYYACIAPNTWVRTALATW